MIEDPQVMVEDLQVMVEDLQVMVEDPRVTLEDLHRQDDMTRSTCHRTTTCDRGVILVPRAR